MAFIMQVVLRNTVGLDWNNTANDLFVMQHGRDQLHDNFPGSIIQIQQSAELACRRNVTE